MNLDSIKISYNKNCKIIIKCNKNVKSYMQYNNKTIGSKKTSSGGEAVYKMASKYKNKKVELIIKDRYSNITKEYTYHT